MMETKDIRLENLLALASAYKRNTMFCEQIKMNPTYFSQLKTHRKSIGDDLARRIEETLSLPRGYLDTPKDAPKEQAQAQNHIPCETMGIAYALETLSQPVREGISRLIYTLAAESAGRAGSRHERSVEPFTISFGSNDGQDTKIQSKEATR
jgi:hypothetical protein